MSLRQAEAPNLLAAFHTDSLSHVKHWFKESQTCIAGPWHPGSVKFWVPLTLGTKSVAKRISTQIHFLESELVSAGTGKGITLTGLIGERVRKGPHEGRSGTGKALYLEELRSLTISLPRF